MWHPRTRPGFNPRRRPLRLEGLEDRCVLATLSPLSPQLLALPALSQPTLPNLAPAGGITPGTTPGGLLGGNGTQGPLGGALAGTPVGQTPGVMNLPGGTTLPGPGTPGGTGSPLPGTFPGTSGLPNTLGNPTGTPVLPGQGPAGNVGGQPGVATVGATTAPNFFPQTGPNNGIDNLQDSQIVLLMNRRVNEAAPASAVGNRPNEGLLRPGEAEAVNPANRATLRSLAVLSGGNDQLDDQQDEVLPAEEVPAPAPQWWDGAPQPQAIPRDQDEAQPAVPQTPPQETGALDQALGELAEQAGVPGRELSGLLTESSLGGWEIGLILAGVGMGMNRRPLLDEDQRARRRRRERAVNV